MNFYSAISHYYNNIFPLNPQQVHFVSNSLPPGSKILEIGSATGNLTRALAEKGYIVVGIDSEKNMIKKAKEENKKPGLEYFQMDMLKVNEFFNEGEFRGLVCFGNTLVHLPSKGTIALFLKRASKIMGHKGYLFIQIVNYNRVLKKNLKQLPEIENEKIKFQRFYELSPSGEKVIFQTRLYVKEEKKVFDQQVELQLLLREELERFLHGSGFKEVEFFGDFKLNPYSEQSLATIVRATLSGGKKV